LIFPNSRFTEEARKEMYQNTGAPIHSAYALPQLLDIYDDSNSAYAAVRSRIHKWQTIASICLSRWIGCTFLPISFSEASWTGLLNFRTCEYEPSVVSLLSESCQQALPTLADIRGGAYRIQSQRSDGTDNNPYWDRWPELQECQLFLGLGDGACANIGSKCSTDSRIAVTVGTSAAARVCLPCPVSKESTDSSSSSSIQIPPGLFCYRIDSEHVLLGGALTDGGSVVEWISELLNLTTPKALEDCMTQVQALLEKDYDSKDAIIINNNITPLTVVPFLSGERSTGYRDGATGAILGLTRETAPAHLVKSCLEGVTLRLKAVLSLIRQTMDERKDADRNNLCIIASGKALEVNILWRQMLADSCGLEVIMDGETEEGTSRGAAVVISTVLSDASSFSDEPLSVLHQSSPNSAAQEYWRRATERQEAFIDSISPLFGAS
jgi:gluconokinase